MTKFLQEMTDFIFLEDEPKKADVIFLPGSEEGSLAKTAAKLYHQGFAPLIVPSGKYAKWTGKSIVEEFETESDHFAKILMEEGVPECAILKEREATYTYQNAINTRKLLDEKGLCHEQVTEFTYSLIMSEDSPLAQKETITFSDLTNYIEVAHADPFLPSVPLSKVMKEETSETISCVGQIGKEGMKETDKEILNIMIGK